jgi:hypothetical protein
MESGFVQDDAVESGKSNAQTDAPLTLFLANPAPSALLCPPAYDRRPLILAQVVP